MMFNESSGKGEGSRIGVRDRSSTWVAKLIDAGDIRALASDSPHIIFNLREFADVFVLEFGAKCFSAKPLWMTRIRVDILIWMDRYCKRTREFGNDLACALGFHFVLRCRERLAHK